MGVIYVTPTIKQGDLPFFFSCLLLLAIGKQGKLKCLAPLIILLGKYKIISRDNWQRRSNSWI